MKTFDKIRCFSYHAQYSARASSLVRTCC